MRHFSLAFVAAASLFSGSRAIALPMPVEAAKEDAPSPQFREAARAADAPRAKNAREYSRMRSLAPVSRVSISGQGKTPLLHSEAPPRRTRSVVRVTSVVTRATMPQNSRSVATRKEPQRLASLPTSPEVAPPAKRDFYTAREYSQEIAGTKMVPGGTLRTSAPIAAAPRIAEAKKLSSAAALSGTVQKPASSTTATLTEKTPVTAKASLPRRAAPVVPASRQMDRDRILLAQLERELRRTQSGLDRADADLTKSQRQLALFSGTLQKAMSEAGVDARGLHPFVRVAQKYAGTPYVWGGESRNGFDCSGFIIVVMRELGYKTLPHSAAEQFNYGMPVAQALLKPGDLVFFANTYKPGVSHVGIYLGKRRFIHAAGTGLGTIVSSLDTPKFQSKYAGARRLVRVR